MVIKMKDLIKAQTDELRKKFIWNEGEAPPEEAPSEPQKLKIDIPETPFEPDVSQIKDGLKQILKQWKIKTFYIHEEDHHSKYDDRH